MTRPDSIDEIKKAKSEFKIFFGFYPTGYRAPGGLISTQGLKNIKKQGLQFDSSFIPSFSSRVSYFFKTQYPHIDRKSGLLEIPFSTISPLRFIASISWMKLLSWQFYKFIFNTFGLPNPIIVGFHLHDIWRIQTNTRLPLVRKIGYFIGRRASGIKTLESLLEYFKSQGYTFTTVGQIAKSFK